MSPSGVRVLVAGTLVSAHHFCGCDVGADRRCDTVYCMACNDLNCTM